MSATLAGASAAASAHLKLERLEKRYGPSLPPAVEALSLEVRKGELLGLLGPSGCGKTTTLRMVGGLVPATSGRILVGGRDVTELPAYRRDMGIVFQSYALFPHMTVGQNIAFGLEMRKVGRAEIAERVRHALSLVRLEALARRRPRELSGGQQQRVALARALVIEPSILLLDEPLSNLDAKLREEMRTEIREIQQRLGITALFVTHDQVEAMAICDRIAVMSAGRLEQLGTPFEVYERPATPFVADFVGRMNHLQGRRGTDGRVDCGPGLLLRAAQDGRPGEPLLVMMRPQRLRLSAAAGGAPLGDNVAAGTVRRVTFVGDAIHTEVDVGGPRLTVEQSTTTAGHPFALGDPVHLAWSAADTLVFPATQAGAA